MHHLYLSEDNIKVTNNQISGSFWPTEHVEAADLLEHRDFV